MRFTPAIVFLTAGAFLPGAFSAPTASLSLVNGRFKGRNIIESDASAPNIGNVEERDDIECTEKAIKGCKTKNWIDPIGLCDSKLPFQHFYLPCGIWPEKEVCDRCLK